MSTVRVVCIKPNSIPTIEYINNDILELNRLVCIDRNGNKSSLKGTFVIREICNDINIVSSPNPEVLSLPLVRQVGRFQKFYGIMYIVKMDSQLNLVSLTESEASYYKEKFSKSTVALEELGLPPVNYHDRVESVPAGVNGKRIMIGTNFINIDDIVSIEEDSISIGSEKSTRKSQDLFSLFSSSPSPTDFSKYLNIMNDSGENKCSFIILKVKAGTQTVFPSSSNDDSWTIGGVSYGTNQLYDFYTICNDYRLVEAVKKWEAESNIEMCCKIGNYNTFHGLHYRNYSTTNMAVDKDIRNRQDFINKYMK